MAPLPPRGGSGGPAYAGDLVAGGSVPRILLTAHEPVPSCGTSPAPAPQASSSGVWKTTEIVSSVCGGITAVTLALAPTIYHLYNGGHLEKTAKLFNTNSMLAGLVNSVVWVLYSIAVLRRDRSIDLIMSNLCSLLSNLHCLAFFYAHRRQNMKGYLVVAVTIMCIFAMFVLEQVDPVKTRGYEVAFGTLGCATQLGCHVLQILDLRGSSAEKVELISVLLNVVPNILLGVVSTVITYLRHSDQLFMNISGFVNCILYFVELVMILRMCDPVKRFFWFEYFNRHTGNAGDIELANLRRGRDTLTGNLDNHISSEAFVLVSVDEIRAFRNGQEIIEESMSRDAENDEITV